MSIAFDPERMEQVKQIYARWWDGSLDRPLIAIRSQERKRSDGGFTLSQATCADFSVSAKEVVEGMEQELNSYTYYGDAYPLLNLDAFGPGVAAAFCGARLDNSSGSVWFYPPEHTPPIDELHITYDPNNQWVRRIKDICEAGYERWRGSVVIGFPDLGGAMDILATFRTSEQLLYDLYDYPDEVKRLVGEIHAAWHEAFRDMAGVLQPNGVFTDWNGILSEVPNQMLQSDFSYMISDDMFREFALEEIRASAKRMGRANYHLDGVGCLSFLDDILSIDEIHMVQWVPGDGQPTGLHWMDIYRRIRESGKCTQVIGAFADLEAVVKELGSGAGVYYNIYYNTTAVSAETLRQSALFTDIFGEDF